MRRATVESLSRRFQEHLGYRPNLSEPKTLQEKLLWRLLFEDMTEAVRLADKVAVRDYVREKIGEQYLVEVLAIAESAEELDFNRLPRAYALKVNHMSGANVIVPDSSVLDIEAARRILRVLLKSKYGTKTGEQWYWDIPPKILVERLLAGESHVVPVEYCLHCFHGRVEFITTRPSKALSDGASPSLRMSASGTAHVDVRPSIASSYSRDWRPMPFRGEHSDPEQLYKDPRPSRLEEMIDVAQVLAGDWGYVRVDFNSVDDRELYFGEMTFSPAAGMGKIVPEHYNEYLGSLWDLPHRYVRKNGDGDGGSAYSPA